MVHISAPMATSTTESKPSIFMAVTSLPGDTMPLNWPMKAGAATAVSALVYGLVSCWMYIIGMGAALFAGTTDISLIMVRAGLGLAGLLIVVFSTVTTTFLDAYSAGISAES